MAEARTEKDRVGEPANGPGGVVVDRALSLIRLPAETVLRVAPKNRMTKSAESALDRADAAVRGAAGAALGDSGLKNDARALRAKIESRAPAPQPTARKAKGPTAPAPKRRTRAKSSQARKKTSEPRSQKRARAKAKEQRAEAHEERQEALRAGEEPLGLKATVDRAKEERKRVDPDVGTGRGANGGA